MRAEGTDNKGPIERTVDELRLQAWLAKAEWKNPSLRDDVSSLAQLRDELKVQTALGKKEMKREWARLERRWARVLHVLNVTGGDLREDLDEALADIRHGYQRLRGH